MPCIQKYFLRKVQDGYDDSIFNIQENQAHVIGKGKEKYYSLVGAMKRFEVVKNEVEIH